MIPMFIRDAKLEDAEAILQIYAPIVEKTAISFETQVPDKNEIQTRIKAYSESHTFLVADDGNTIQGYCYGSSFRPRKAYGKTAEVTVYVAEDQQGKGIGHSLYAELFKQLIDRGFHTAIAGITLPNPASIALHRASGFKTVGTLREVGHKLDRWHDVQWWQKQLI